MRTKEQIYADIIKRKEDIIFIQQCLANDSDVRLVGGFTSLTISLKNNRDLKKGFRALIDTYELEILALNNELKQLENGNKI